MGMKSRRKGRAFEREIVRELKREGIDARRGWWQSDGGEAIADVETPDLWIECSTGAHVSGVAKLQQARDRHARSPRGVGRTVLAVVHRKGERRKTAWIALSDLVRLDAPGGLIVACDWQDFVGFLTARHRETA